MDLDSVSDSSSQEDFTSDDDSEAADEEQRETASRMDNIKAGPAREGASQIAFGDNVKVGADIWMALEIAFHGDGWGESQMCLVYEPSMADENIL